MTKTCTKCKQEKDLEDFGKLKAATDGRHSWCNVCKYADYKEYRKKNQERLRDYNKANHVKNRVERLRAMVEYRQKNLERLRQKDAEKYERLKAKRKELGLGRKSRRVTEDGRVECTKCKEFRMREEFSPTTKTQLGLFAHCKACIAKNVRAWRMENYDRDKARHAAYREQNRERIRETQNKRYAELGTTKYFEHIRGAYGLTEDQYFAMLESQQECCFICLQEFRYTGRKDSPCIDHDHTTGKVRGILCGSCNLALGQVRDNPAILRKMIEYLEK